ncbi:hypothetical protein SAMN02745126_05922 [Enhydrobacter aerosaccus]|uniref:Beta-barrel porin 2 n=1 Tax=Enhydrobacter aerosaccus TaxID=225324 RepID=A0A1T4TA61_9HYPH|nr:outer membrane beta-barrel protein [Enhydrobacter aerosaccus]SKA37267.1 hypothetical protein SAMN02745126_05922 [Enhydrobacter aerosaccus]
MLHQGSSEPRLSNVPQAIPLVTMSPCFCTWLTAVLLGATCAGNAFAQVPSGTTSQIPAEQRVAPPPGQDNLTPKERAAENYNAQGMRVGSFLMFPSLELNEVFDDNIFAAPSSSGKTGSFIQIIKPSIELRSQWSQHMLNMYARGAFAFYSAAASQNYQDVATGADGRFDITKGSNAYGGLSYSHNHEALGTPNSPIGVFQISQYNQYSANAGYYQEFGRFRTRLDGRMDAYDYNNNGQGPAQGVIINTDRNRIELRESLRLGYEFLPGYEIWTRGDLNQRRYANNPDSSGLFRNSSGFDIVGGFAVAVSTITSFEVFAGYVQQDYVDPAFSNIRAPTFGLTGYWSPTRELLVKPYVRRTIDDSSLTTASAYLNTSGGLDVNYNFRPNIRLDGHADYSIADYQTVAGAAGRYDQYFTIRGGVVYSPTPNFFVGPTYQFVHRTSNQVGLSYDDNQVLLRLGAQL